ncbi:hypothetical protein F4803DRAFT_448621 [Xylaria telfairii]|nr:hypothetical protein F4803DRAFT_448621 [Xylaria telfairii]
MYCTWIPCMHNLLCHSSLVASITITTAVLTCLLPVGLMIRRRSAWVLVCCKPRSIDYGQVINQGGTNAVDGRRETIQLIGLGFRSTRYGADITSHVPWAWELLASMMSHYIFTAGIILCLCIRRLVIT